MPAWSCGPAFPSVLIFPAHSIMLRSWTKHVPLKLDMRERGLVRHPGSNAAMNPAALPWSLPGPGCPVGQGPARPGFLGMGTRHSIQSEPSLRASDLIAAANGRPVPHASHFIASTWSRAHSQSSDGDGEPVWSWLTPGSHRCPGVIHDKHFIALRKASVNCWAAGGPPPRPLQKNGREKGFSASHNG